MGANNRAALGNQELDRVEVSFHLLLESRSFFSCGDMQDSHVQPRSARCLLMDQLSEFRQCLAPGANARYGGDHTMGDLQERLKAQRRSDQSLRSADASSSM
jgi:hypothetical protein